MFNPRMSEDQISKLYTLIKNVGVFLAFHLNSFNSNLLNITCSYKLIQWLLKDGTNKSGAWGFLIKPNPAQENRANHKSPTSSAWQSYVFSLVDPHQPEETLMK